MQRYLSSCLFAVWFASCGSVDEPKLADASDTPTPPDSTTIDTLSKQLAEFRLRLTATEARVDILDKQVLELQKSRGTTFSWSKSDYVAYSGGFGSPIASAWIPPVTITGGPKKVVAFISTSAIDDKGAAAPRFCMAHISNVDGVAPTRLSGVFGTTPPNVTDAKPAVWMGLASTIEFAVEATQPCIYSAVVLQIGDGT